MNLKWDNISSGKQLLFLLFFAFALNVNTLFNEYALDDEVVMTKNSLVSQGIKAIPKILSTDLMYGTADAQNALTQARYRPFTLLLFAVEYQFFGANPFVSHFFNILLFELLIFLLFILLQKKLFQYETNYFSFLVCAFFIAHPLHCEVIANVKSRDEIVTFLFVLLTYFQVIKYVDSQKKIQLVIGAVSFFLALLTRESAVSAIAIIPFMLYFFRNQPINKLVFITVPFILVLIAYVVLRIEVIGLGQAAEKSIMDSPFLYASTTEAFATKVYILVKNIFLMIYPQPLSCDYGYNQIPYVQLSSPLFLVSALVVLSLLLYGIFNFTKKSAYTFSIIYFFCSIFLATNFILDIGTPLSERLLFQPSLAICIVFSILAHKLHANAKWLSGSVVVLVLLLFSIKTIARNSEWKNNETLFFKDAESAPNSVRTNLYAAVNYTRKASGETLEAGKQKDFEKAIYYGERAKLLLNNYPETYVALGFAYYGQQNLASASENWRVANQLDPNNNIVQQCLQMLSTDFFVHGNKCYQLGQTKEAIAFYEKAVEVYSANVEAWYKLGGNYFLVNETKKGIEAWQIVLSYAPSHPLIKEDFRIN